MDAHAGQRVDLPRHLADVAHHGGFGDLDLQSRRRKLVVTQALDHIAGEIKSGELQGSDIERDAYRVKATVLPFAALTAALVEYPVSERHNQPAFFRCWHESVRIGHPEHGMVQPHQRLKAAELSIPGVERLVVQL